MYKEDRKIMLQHCHSCLPSVDVTNKPGENITPCLKPSSSLKKHSPVLDAQYCSEPATPTLNKPERHIHRNLSDLGQRIKKRVTYRLMSLNDPSDRKDDMCVPILKRTNNVYDKDACSDNEQINEAAETDDKTSQSGSCSEEEQEEEKDSNIDECQSNDENVFDEDQVTKPLCNSTHNINDFTKTISETAQLNLNKFSRTKRKLSGRRLKPGVVSSPDLSTNVIPCNVPSTMCTSFSGVVSNSSFNNQNDK